MAITVTPLISRILVGFVCLLIFFLAYPPQYFFLHTYNRLYAPWWTGWHTFWFNFCVFSIWVSYARSIGTDPGGLPRGQDGEGLWVPDGVDELNGGSGNGNGEKREEDVGRMKTGKLWGKGVGRWCKKCEVWKPPRCHHCRKCERCVLRMDHHCPWMNNCIGYQNLPHFLRFLSYSTFTTLYLEYHLIKICLELWDLPNSYLFPTPVLSYLVITITINTFTAFGLTLLTARTLFSVAEGTTTIEEWEKERHASLVRRKVVKKVVFLYDIGIWENLVEAMGGGGWWGWWWVGTKTRKTWKPLGKGKGKEGKNRGKKEWDWEKDGGGGVRWEVNGFEDPSTPWPPPDPARQSATFNPRGLSSPRVSTSLDDKEYIAAFRERQQADLKRWVKKGGEEQDDRECELPEKLKPKPGSEWDGVWRNEDGATLADYGVDEDAEGGTEEQEAGSKLIPVRTTTSYATATSAEENAGMGRKGKGKDNANAGMSTGIDDDEEVTLAELLRRRRLAEREHDYKSLRDDLAPGAGHVSLDVFSG